MGRDFVFLTQQAHVGMVVQLSETGSNRCRLG